LGRNLAVEQFEGAGFAPFKLAQEGDFIQKKTAKILLHHQGGVTVADKFHEVHHVIRELLGNIGLVAAVDGEQRKRNLAKHPSGFYIHFIVAKWRRIAELVKTCNQLVVIILAASNASETFGVAQRGRVAEIND